MNSSVGRASIDNETRDESLRRRIVAFMRNASTEVSTHDEPVLDELATRLSPGTTVYVAHTPKASLEDVLRVAGRIQGLGFRASPHIVARRLINSRQLGDALHRLSDLGVEQVLLIAGDTETPVGDFSSTLEVLGSGLLERSGIRRVGVAGHPEGHRAVSPEILEAALRSKQEFAKRTGVSVHIVTQFTFDPQGTCVWAQNLTANGLRLPVHVGIAGPTPLGRLVKFAMQCGVGASVQSLWKNANTLANLTRAAKAPAEMVVGILSQDLYSTSGIVQPHFYAFGGILATATWLHETAAGNFAVAADCRSFAS